MFPDGSPCNGEPGGYELGAGVLSKGSWSNAHLEQLLVRHDIAYTNVVEPSRTKYRFYIDGHRVDAAFLLKSVLSHPLGTLRAIFGFLKSQLDFWRYSRHRQIDFGGRPKALSKTLSEVYPSELNLCAAFGVQGFGYAHLPDAALTPPLLYYHQYVPPDVIVNPICTVPIGMQGIWAKVAATYPTDKARLNQEVIRVTRRLDAVQLHTADSEETFDYLIVAVPLGPALKFMDFSPTQEALLSCVLTNHYITVLCRVSGLTDIGNCNVRKAVDRREVGGIVFAYKRYADSDWVSINLYVDPQCPQTDEAIIDTVAANLRNDFGAELVERSAAKVFHWPDYFPHLGSQDLDDGWYERFEQTIQGQQRTLFVSSGLHMETVGASVQYATIKVTEAADRWLGNRA